MLMLLSSFVLETPIVAVTTGLETLVETATGWPGMAAGSVFAYHIGQEVKQSGPIVRRIRRSRWDVMEWSEKRSVQLAQRYGYVGLAMALSVPFFPDTISIYAFAVLERNYTRFAVATFLGSLGRHLVTAGFFGGVSAVF